MKIFSKRKRFTFSWKPKRVFYQYMFSKRILDFPSRKDKDQIESFYNDKYISDVLRLKTLNFVAEEGFEFYFPRFVAFTKKQ